jgi:predicted DNA-binding transcriptional regulator YafY
VEMEYKNNNNEVSKRIVEPIGLIFYAFSWHVIGWCHMRQECRDFKVVRILKFKKTEQPFTKENHVSLNDYMKLLPVNY